MAFNPYYMTNVGSVYVRWCLWQMGLNRVFPPRKELPIEQFSVMDVFTDLVCQRIVAFSSSQYVPTIKATYPQNLSTESYNECINCIGQKYKVAQRIALPSLIKHGFPIGNTDFVYFDEVVLHRGDRESGMKLLILTLPSGIQIASRVINFKSSTEKHLLGMVRQVLKDGLKPGFTLVFDGRFNSETLLGSLLELGINFLTRKNLDDSDPENPDWPFNSDDKPIRKQSSENSDEEEEEELSLVICSNTQLSQEDIANAYFGFDETMEENYDLFIQMINTFTVLKNSSPSRDFAKAEFFINLTAINVLRMLQAALDHNYSLDTIKYHLSFFETHELGGDRYEIIIDPPIKKLQEKLGGPFFDSNIVSRDEIQAAYLWRNVKELHLKGQKASE